MPDSAAVFDRALFASRQRRKRKPEANVLTRTIAEELVERLSFVKRTFPHGLIIAPDPQAIAARLEQTGQFGKITPHGPSADENLGLAPESFDVIISVFDLQSAQ